MGELAKSQLPEHTGESEQLQYLTFLLTSADESEPTDTEALGRVPM